MCLIPSSVYSYRLFAGLRVREGHLTPELLLKIRCHTLLTLGQLTRLTIIDFEYVCVCGGGGNVTEARVSAFLTVICRNYAQMSGVLCAEGPL